MELLVYFALQKDGENDNSSQTLVMVRGRHNFKSIFPEKGKYILFVNIKNIYYTHTTLNFIFELNVDIVIVANAIFQLHHSKEKDHLLCCL